MAAAGPCVHMPRRGQFVVSNGLLVLACLWVELLGWFVTGRRVRPVERKLELRSACEPKFPVDVLEGVVDGAY